MFRVEEKEEKKKTKKEGGMYYYPDPDSLDLDIAVLNKFASLKISAPLYKSEIPLAI